MSFRAETGSWTIPPRNPNLFDAPDTTTSGRNGKSAEEPGRLEGKDNAAFEFVEVDLNSDAVDASKSKAKDSEAPTEQDVPKEAITTEV